MSLCHYAVHGGVCKEFFRYEKDQNSERLNLVCVQIGYTKIARSKAIDINNSLSNVYSRCTIRSTIHMYRLYVCYVQNLTGSQSKPVFT